MTSIELQKVLYLKKSFNVFLANSVWPVIFNLLQNCNVFGRNFIFLAKKPIYDMTFANNQKLQPLHQFRVILQPLAETNFILVYPLFSSIFNGRV